MNRIIGSVSTLIKKYHLQAFKDVIIFMAILLFFHFLYRALNREIMSVHFISDSAFFLADKVYYSSKWILEIFNVNVSFFDELSIDGAIRKFVFYYPENNGYVSVNRGCSGMKQFYQWTILMILFPGPWKHKLWFIPFGLGIIHLVNVFRIVSMVMVTINIPQHWDFIHDYILRPFFYVVIFAMWVWWNEKFRRRKESKQQ